MAVEKVAVTVDRQLLARVENLRRRTGESRSALFGRALRMLLLERDRSEKVKKYVDAYRKMPETSEEIADAEALAVESLRHAPPWEEG